jgi:heme oxygenase
LDQLEERLKSRIFTGTGKMPVLHTVNCSKLINIMNNNLASKLREGTKHSHTMAENTAFIKCFLKGIVEKEPLRKLMADFYFLYSTLEDALEEHKDHPVISLIYFPELNRKKNLEKDLAFYYGEDWRNQIAPSTAGKVYCDRIREVAATEPALLVAHAYTRYMGDLSGGQGLRKIVRSSIELPPELGTKFYEFEQIPSPEDKRIFKDKYRQALDSLPVDDQLAQKIVDEANYAFSLNRDVAHELEPEVRRAIGDTLFIQITRQDKIGSTEGRTSGDILPNPLTSGYAL